jgi:lipoyl-dependent peroxiredoxin
MEKIEKVLASGNSHAEFNHGPNVQRGALDLKLSGAGVDNLEFIATELHPRAEQLFAGAWSGCYATVFGMAAQAKKVTLPPDYSVDIQVSIGTVGNGYCLAAQATVRVPGLAKEVGEELAQLAHQLCPYSKAVHGNIEISTNVVTV